MSIALSNAFVVVALISAVSLVVAGGDRVFPILATVAAALEALIGFGIITLALPKVRIDLILPALLVVSGGVCWSRASAKSAATASAALTLVGLIQLLSALHVLR